MTPTDSTLMLAERIDAACDAFESAWRSEDAQPIEHFLAGTPDHERAAMLTALLRVELELKRRAGQPSDITVYLRRFPGFKDEVQQVFSESQAVVDTSVSNIPATVDLDDSRQLDGDVEEPIPATLGRFEVLAKIGQGAFGTVLKARDPDLDRSVAIKLPRRGALRPSDIERFLREGKAAANMLHPNICPVYEVGTADGRPYIVMSLVPGKSLAEHLKQAKGPLPIRQAVLIVRKLALALQLAHNKGIVHRDLKPANVMLDRERKDVVIMDFGLARMERHDDIGLTASGMVMGTPAYMSPEQARGDQKAIGPATDIYSLGVILHELLTRERPFEGSLAEVLGKILHVEAPGPTATRPDVPPQLDQVVRKCMAKNPHERYGSMRDLAEALSPFLKELPAPPESFFPPTIGSAAKGPAPSGDDVLAALALEVKEQFQQQQAETRSAITDAVNRSRIPFWQLLTAAGLFGILLLAGIIFFARTPTAQVMINIDVNLKDPELAFLLDKKPISPAKLASPIELAVGKHELLIYRGKELERRFQFVVKGGEKPSLTFTEKWSRDPPQPPHEPEEEAGWQTILGSDLTGWTPLHSKGRQQDEHDPTTSGWEVLRDGEVTCVTNRPGWLRYDRKLGDFELKLDFRVPQGANSGVLLRSPGTGTLYHTSIEVQIVDDRLAKGRNPRTGAVFGANNPEPSLVRPDGEWNTLHVVCRDQQVRVIVNGKRASDINLAEHPRFKDVPATGYLGLYNFSGMANQVAFRNIRIRELPGSAVDKTAQASPHTAGENGWKTILSHDLTGWTPMQSSGPQQQYHEPATGGWDVSDRQVTCVTNEPGWLRYDRKLSDFELALEFRVPEGANSGILLRSTGVGSLPQSSVEIQIIDDRLSRAPLDRSGAVWGITGPAHSLLKPANQWNELHVVCRGPKIRTSINGTLAADFDLSTDAKSKGLPSAGYLGLFNWRGQGHRVSFRNIRVRDFSETDDDSASAANLAAERQFAAWILDQRHGSLTVRVGDAERHFGAAAPSSSLPTEPLRIVYVRLPAQPSLTADHLKPLAVCSELTEIDLHHNAHLGPEALSPLRALHKVRRLVLSGDLGLGDAALAHVSHLRDLEELHIQKTGVSDASVARIAGAFPKLHTLLLTENAISDAGLSAGLRGLKLKTLSLTQTKVTDAGLAHLKEIETLEMLRLCDLPLTDAGLEHLTALKNLQNLDLRDTAVTAAGIEKLQAALPQCQIQWGPKTGPASEIDLAAERQFAVWILDQQNGSVTVRVGETEQHFDHTVPSSSLPQEPFRIVHMRLSAEPNLTAQDLEPLAICSELTEINLHHNPHLGPEALAPIRALQKVRSLVLFGDSGLGDAALEHVLHLRELETLHIQNTGITDAGIERIAGAFPELQTLNVSQTSITNAALPHLSAFPKLTSFNAGVTQITDEGLVHLRGLQLKTLGLTKLQLTGAGIAPLGSLKTLEDLRMLETPVTDADMRHLESLKNLQRLYIGWTKVTPEGERRLKAALPQLFIGHDYP